MPDTQPPRAVIFDWDNTLIDSWVTIHAALDETFRTMGHVPWTLEETKQRVRYSMRESFPKLFGDKWEHAAKTFYDAFERLHLERLAPVHGAGDMLVALHGRTECLSIVSNKTGRYLRTEVSHLGWDPYFHRVIGAGDAPRDKPAADPVFHALDGSAIAPGPDVWFVGDAGIDMEIAHLTGCVPVLLHGGSDPDEDFGDFQPKVRFRSCIELASFVGAL